MSPVTIIDQALFPFAVKLAAVRGGVETFLGSGFVAAPGFVLTCAHVVAGIAADARLRVDSALPAVDAARPVLRGYAPRRSKPDRTWGRPDLAIIELLDTEGRRLTGHPCPRLDVSGVPPHLPLRHRAVVAARLRPELAVSEVHVRGIDLLWESGDDHGLWWYTGGQAVPGMSGGMVVDVERRAVVAVVNSTRGKSAGNGAVATPLSALDSAFDEPDMASAAAELVRAVREAGAREHDAWERGFARRGDVEWRDYWSPDAGGEHFVGRDRELARLEAALDDSGGVALVRSIGGFGGIGKTSLAVAFSERFRDRFPDGRVFHDFGSYRAGRSDTATDALGTVLTAVGAVAVDEIGRLDHRERADRWRAAIAGRRLLMVWDNVDSREQLNGLLLHAAGTATIVTSRDSVRGLGSGHVRLDVLTEADAVAMFRGIAGDGHPEELVLALVRRDLYVPVLIHTHATEVADAESLLSDIVADLPDPAVARRAVDPERQRDLFDRLAGSYRRLDVAVRFAFRALGAHPGYRVTLGALAAAMDCDARTARDRVQALVRAGLAIRDGGVDEVPLELRTYRSHDLLRAYGAHLAAAEPAGDGSGGTELDRLHAVLADHYLRRLNGDTANNERDWFGVEVDGIRDLALSHQDKRYGDLARYLGYRGVVFNRFDAAEAGFRHAQPIDERRGDTARVAHCRWGLGEVARARGGLDRARRHYTEALELSRRAGDQGGIGNAERGLAEVAQLGGDADTAEAHYRAALAAYRASAFPRRAVYPLRGLARVAELKGEFDTARDLFATALAESGREGDGVGAASARQGLADVALAVGDLAAAAEHYRGAEADFTAAGDLVGAARAVRGLGRVALAGGDRAAAREHFERAEAVFDEYDALIWLEQVRADLAEL